MRFPKRKRVAATKTRQARGQLCSAKAQSPSPIAKNERVNPQNGQGYPVNHKNVHFLKGRRLHKNLFDITRGTHDAIARGRCTPTTSQYDEGRFHDIKEKTPLRACGSSVMDMGETYPG
ncbi:MAG: hypothetical protein SV686_10600 [Thermodesulfobacteriota bacterium]|nr:hypothetical protein [Thermodesulfobacteriota bacterium]